MLKVFYGLLSSVTVCLVLAVMPAIAQGQFFFGSRSEAIGLADAIDPDLYAFLQIMKQFGSEYAPKLT